MQEYFYFTPDENRGFIFLEFYIRFKSYIMRELLNSSKFYLVSILSGESRLYRIAVRLEALDKIKCRTQENDSTQRVL